MEPDQTAPGSTLFVYEASNILVDDKNKHFVSSALRVYKSEFSMFTVRIFMKCAHVCAAQTTYYFLTKL